MRIVAKPLHRAVTLFAGLGLALTLLFSGGGAWAETLAYTYDALGRITSATVTEGPRKGFSVHYTYDAAGNRTIVTTTPAGVVVVPLGSGYAIIPVGR